MNQTRKNQNAHQQERPPTERSVCGALPGECSERILCRHAPIRVYERTISVNIVLHCRDRTGRPARDPSLSVHVLERSVKPLSDIRELFMMKREKNEAKKN